MQAISQRLGTSESLLLACLGFDFGGIYTLSQSALPPNVRIFFAPCREHRPARRSNVASVRLAPGQTISPCHVRGSGNFSRDSGFSLSRVQYRVVAGDKARRPQESRHHLACGSWARDDTFRLTAENRFFEIAADYVGLIANILFGNEHYALGGSAQLHQSAA